MIRWYECRIRYRGKMRDAFTINWLGTYPRFYIITVLENKYRKFIVGKFKHSPITRETKLFKLSPGYLTLEAAKAAAELLV